MAKILLDVTAEHLKDGKTRPLSIRWQDGRVFEVDKVLDVRLAPSLKAGGHGDRGEVGLSV